MAKTRTLYVCQQCEYSTPKWMGKCPDCGGWNTFEEQRQVSNAAVSTPGAIPKPIPFDDVEKANTIYAFSSADFGRGEAAPKRRPTGGKGRRRGRAK